MDRVAIIAPHPDDETLGCGGTLLKHRAAGDKVSWIIVTQMEESLGFDAASIENRKKTIANVSNLYGFESTDIIGLPTTKLDSFSKSLLILKFKEYLEKIRPSILYVPFPGDVHNDHAITFETAIACCKSFRADYVKRILCYETLSETEQGIDPRYKPFSPNVWVDISDYLDTKIEIMKSCYQGEMGSFPFPRSVDSIRAQAMFRGCAVGVKAAESFSLLKEIL